MNPLENVQKELAAAYEQRADLDAKIQALHESAKLLEPIYGIHPAKGALLQHLAGIGDIKDLGITAAVERILIVNAGKWLPPTSVRNGLKEAGFELQGGNPLASIHQVLKRLVERQSLFVSAEIHGQTMYKYDIGRAIGQYGSGSILGAPALVPPSDVSPPEELPELTAPDVERSRKK